MAELTDEQRDWDEYLAWTRGSDPQSYDAIESKAWQRLQSAALRRRVQTYTTPAPSEATTPDLWRELESDLDQGV